MSVAVEFLGVEAAIAHGVPAPDIYDHATYGLSAELIDGGEWECAASVDGTASFAYVKRAIPGGGYDIVSPYGYGGITAPGVAALRAFRTAFLEQSRARGLVAEFLRTNPLDVGDAELAAIDPDTTTPHRTFVVRRGDDVDEYWDAAEGRHRTAVRKAQKSGIEVAVAASAGCIDPTSGFRRMYDLTMERVGASGRLRLDDDYYRRLVGGLEDRLTVLEARHDGAVCGAAMFMRWNDRLHYHLSGSTPEGLALGATNLLLDHAIRHLLGPGGVLHLGGGVTSDDGLERFKRSLATDSCTVHFCRTVVDRDRYDELVRAHGSADSDYFPAYRA